MSAQRKNLLEAFKNAGDVPDLSKAAPPPASPPSRPPSAAGAAPTRERKPLRERASLDLPSLPGEVPTGLFLAAAAGLIFALGVFVGVRFSQPDVAEAGSEPDGPAALVGGISTGPGIVPPRDLGTRGPRAELPTLEEARQTPIEESPLFDKENRYTVVVATYTTQNPDPAWGTYMHLRSEGLDVFPPVVKNEHLMILVGAAPRSRDLAATEERIRQLRREGENPYHDAYRAPIDRYIER